ncbi:uncharacterized protein VTP21DRAFT_10064 [Calcarisporiella thermophila]|uniref:uncharacterized protein n=1 Tax=Calcarisporiella thermophila TaxID=911321 RepID=UPI003743E57D
MFATRKGLYQAVAATRVSRIPYYPTASLLNSRRVFSGSGIVRNDAQEKSSEVKSEEKSASAASENKNVPKDEKKEAMEKEIAEWKDRYIRSLADMENLRQRTRKEVEQTSQYAIQKFAKDLLDTVDILGLALRSVPEEARSDKSEANSHLVNLYTGLSMTETELIKTLRRHGVEAFGSEGDAFDPNMHQALYQSPVPDKEVGTVFRVEKIGYTLKGRVLRPAQVGVVAEPPSS